MCLKLILNQFRTRKYMLSFFIVLCNLLKNKIECFFYFFKNQLSDYLIHLLRFLNPLLQIIFFYFLLIFY